MKQPQKKEKNTEACHFSEACVAGTQIYFIVGLPNRSHVLNASDQFWLSKWITDHRSWEKAMVIVPEITSVDGVARHSQIIRLPAPPSLLVDNTCRRAGTKQMGARGEAQGIRWYGGLHGQNSTRGKFRTSPRKMRGKFRTKMKYGIFPAEKSPRGISPPCMCRKHEADVTCIFGAPQCSKVWHIKLHLCYCMSTMSQIHLMQPISFLSKLHVKVAVAMQEHTAQPI